MTEDPNDEVSLFDLASTVVRHRWSIARWMIAGGAVAVIPVLAQQPSYTAMASFVLQNQGAESQTSGLRSLAGQFGLSLGGGGSGQSPQFYADLLKSPAILSPILGETFTVREAARRQATLLELLDVQGPTPERRSEQGVQALAQLVVPRVNPVTGVVTVQVTTRWPSLSALIADSIIAGINSFALRNRQGQSGDERRFIEARLAEASKLLRDAEDKLQAFLQGNRSWENSAELRFSRDRLQRYLDLHQQVVISLSQSYEEARIGEVRALPSITVIQRPMPPTTSDPRGRTKRGLLGMLFGGLVGVVISFAGESLHRRREAGDPHVERFFKSLADVRSDFSWRPRGRSRHE